VRAADAAVARARVALRRARHDAERIAELARSGFVAPARLESDQLAALAAGKDLDSAIAQREMAAYEAEQARAALQVGAGPAAAGGPAVPLRSPIAGQVLRVIQTSEATVALGAPLLELGDLGQLEVMAELLTTDALQCRPGSPVRIERWGGPPLRGRVRRIEPAGFTKISALGVEEQRVRVLIDLLDGDAARRALGVGYRVDVRIVTLRLDKVRKVPARALFPLPDNDRAARGAMGAMGVYVVRDGRARLTRVEVGARNELEAWVRDGVAEGDTVVIYPPTEVRDGVRVQVRSVARPR
jgi:HlyD family secretion protein